MRTLAERLNFAIRRAGWIIKGAGPAKKEDKGRTVADLAESIGVDASWISRLLSEGRPQSAKTLADAARLCAKLGVDFQWLALGDTSKAPPDEQTGEEPPRRDTRPPPSNVRQSSPAGSGKK